MPHVLRVTHRENYLFFHGISRPHLAPTAVAALLAGRRPVLRTALRRAERHGLVRSNVAATAEGLPVQDRERPTLTPEHVRSILAGAKGRRFMH